MILGYVALVSNRDEDDEQRNEVGESRLQRLWSTLFDRLSHCLLQSVELDVMDAGTAGMMATAAGGLFFLAMIAAPRYGIASRTAGNIALSLKMAGEDLLGVWYREEERQHEGTNRLRVADQELAHEEAGIPSPSTRPAGEGRGPDIERAPPGMAMISFPDEQGWRMWLAVRRLEWKGYARRTDGRWQLTSRGRDAAQQIVRAHRLWESYLAKHFSVEDPRLHESAGRAEHFIDEWLRTQLSTELDEPDRDPHGSVIPSEGVETLDDRHESAKESGKQRPVN